MFPTVNSKYNPQNNQGVTMDMPTETAAAAGGALLKLFGAPLLGSIGAIALGFVILWPRTVKEALSRFICTLLFSMFFGPVLVIAVRAYYPNTFEIAREVAALYGVEPAFGFLFVAAPLMAAAGLPVWWVMGAFMRWFDNRRDKDIGQMATDAVDTVKAVKGAIL